jgi:DNA-directed RNA polymerase specialized sigma24 family protein
MWPSLRLEIRGLCRGIVPHLRDDFHSFCMVVIVKARDAFDESRGDLRNHISFRLAMAVHEFNRTQYRVHRGGPCRSDVFHSLNIPGIDGEGELADAFASDGISAQRRVELMDALQMISILPPREREALLTEDVEAMADLLGVSVARIYQLRRRARDRLWNNGFYELLEDAA